jgi:hypothetical protein
MTPKQLGIKARQLYSRKRLIETVESLEEAIKTFMTLEGKSEIHTGNFAIRLVDGTLDVSVRPSTHLNQLTLKFRTETKFQRQGEHYQ